MIIKFDLSGGRVEGRLLGVNDHTVWVRLPGGNCVKRHITKHGVEGLPR